MPMTHLSPLHLGLPATGREMASPPAGFHTALPAGLLLILALVVPAVSAAQPDDVRVHYLNPWEIPIQGQADLLQCQDGFIWIAGNERLWRYDGHRFVGVHPDRSGKPLPSWIVKGLAGGRRGVIAIFGSSNEVVLYEIATNRARVVALPPRAGGSAVNRISCVLEDSEGRFLVGTEADGVYVLDAANGRLERLLSREGGEGGDDRLFVADIEEDARGGLWFATSNGLWHLPNGIPGVPLPPGDRPERFQPAFDLAGMALGHDRRVWVILRNGEFGWIEPATGAFVRCAPVFEDSRGQKPWSNLMCVDRRGDVWSMAGGLIRWDHRRRRWESVLPSGRDSLTAEATPTSFLRCDRSGNLWVGTNGGGLYRFTPSAGRFRSCTPESQNPAGLRSSNVLSLWKDREGTLWVGTVSSGISYLRPGARRFQHLRAHHFSTTSAWGNMVTCIREGSGDELWVGRVGKEGVSVIDRKTARFVEPSLTRERMRNLGSDTVTAMHRDRSGTMWVGHFAGLDRYDEEAGTFRAAIRWDRPSLGVRGSIGYITEDDRGNLWLAAVDRGLGRLRIETGEVVWYRHDPEDPRSLPARAVWCAYYDSLRRTLWVPGTGWEIARLDPESDAFVTYRLEPSVPGSPPGRSRPNPDRSEVSPTGITGDSGGNLWISVWGHIIRFNPDDGTFCSYDHTDGIVVADTRRNGFQRADDGTIYLGGSGGLTWFHPDRMELNEVVPRVALTRFSIFGRPVPLSPFGGDEIRLGHDEHTLSFEFAALEFTDPSKNQFMYMLEGSGGTWEYLGTDRRVTFAHMKPGAYLLRVRASNNDGVWNTEGLALKFTIAPPYWQAFWFRSLGIAVAVAAVTLFVLARRVRRREMQQVRIRIANDLHDDIGSELSAIALESDLIARRLTAAPEQQRRIQGVGRAVREAAEKLRDVVWIVNPEQEKLSDLVARMRQIAPAMLGGLHVSCTIPRTTPPGPIAMTVKRNILLMYKEILTNIARHARATRVTIQIGAADGVLDLTVRDDGVGFDPSTITQGRGLKSIRTRANDLGGTLSIDSTPGSGTSVRFRGRITHLKD